MATAYDVEEEEGQRFAASRPSTTSSVSGFGKLNVAERRTVLAAHANLSDADLGTICATLDDGDRDTQGPDPHAAPPPSLDHVVNMTENVVGASSLPFSVAPHFCVNGKDYFVPMVTEESSVVAAASYGAKLARDLGGFAAVASANVMTSQVVLRNCGSQALAAVESAEPDLLAAANAIRPSLVKRGGGAVRITTELLSTRRGPMVSVLLHVDVCDCMGANTVTIMAEGIAPELARLTGGTVVMAIVSNLCSERTVVASAEWSPATLEATAKGCGMSGDEVIEAILDADAIGAADPRRAATHNKGVMNGVSALVSAIMGDTRAVEAATHAHAATDNTSPSGSYTTLTRYEKTPEGNLRGTIELPFPIQTIGGATHAPTAAFALAVLGLVEESDDVAAGDRTRELACVMAAVGLAQNFAALRAIVTGSLTRGHMSLHAKNLAVAAGAKGAMVEVVAAALAASGSVTSGTAADLVEQYCAIL